MSTLRRRGYINDSYSLCYIFWSVYEEERQTKCNSIEKECLPRLLWCETGKPRQVLGPTQNMYNLYIGIQLVDERKKSISHLEFQCFPNLLNRVMHYLVSFYWVRCNCYVVADTFIKVSSYMHRRKQGGGFRGQNPPLEEWCSAIYTW